MKGNTSHEESTLTAKYKRSIEVSLHIDHTTSDLGVI